MANPEIFRKCYWFTGLSGSGKTTIAQAFRSALLEQGVVSVMLDGDELRKGLNRDLGFSRQDRQENVRRLAEIARLLVDAEIAVLVSAISPYRQDRDAARSLFKDGDFFEIHIATDLATCMARDTKGLYKRANEGRLENMTGLHAPYEPPLQPELRIDASTTDLPASVELLLDHCWRLR